MANSQSITDSEKSIINELLARAREKNLQTVSTASLVRLFGPERAPEVAQSVGLLLDGVKYIIPEMSFAEVVQILSTGKKLHGIREVDNHEMSANISHLQSAESLKKPWQS